MFQRQTRRDFFVRRPPTPQRGIDAFIDVFATMDDDEMDVMIDEAAKLVIAHQGLSIRNCLILAGFTQEEAKQRKLQMQVSRRPAVVAQKKKKRKNDADGRGALVTPKSSTRTYPPPEAPQFNMGTAKLQKKRNHEKKVRRHKNLAFKRATTLYAEQLKKPDEKDRLSAADVAKLVAREFGRGYSPSARSILRNVKEGLVGVSPVKPGRKSDLHEFTFGRRPARRRRRRSRARRLRTPARRCSA